MLFKRRTKKHDTSIAPGEAPWQSCIAVCSKCARKVKGMHGDKTKLRVALKALIALRGIKKTVRPVDVSCLDICPENKIVVMHLSGPGNRVLLVGPETPPENILGELGY